ncbi:histidine kinase [Chryseobacterium sp. Leaf180]|uniref:DUF72 domain-containing protein n=1 Tax=Chryseobacterium sp. Leaf180 TaxID=1736289 RepID=UPI0006FA099B|nr:DUF72 domain-containing protein [Chryseobacterium sp. Leaf180]KQR95658.1 histidine kinase [Chryseobacterium sp. Leaf180]
MNFKDFYIGCSGFYNPAWKGSFYPADAKNLDFLTLYSQQLNAVEINSTFYRKPTVKTLERWKSETPDDFKFFIKIPKAITHINRLVDSKNSVDGFCSYISENLGEKLAGFLYQFPPSFKNTEETRELIGKNIANDFLNVIEFRHETWFDEEAFKFLAKLKLVFSGTSFPGKIPDTLIANHPKILYYRLHGNPFLYKSEYTEEFLVNLAENLIKSNRKSFIFFNNTWGTSAIKNAPELIQIIKNKL